MRYRQVDLNLLVVFNELIENSSVLRASRALGVTQGAVSQSLAKLRKHFDDELFIKTNTGVTPTTFAISIAEDVRQSIAFAEAALGGRARFDPAISARDIRICMGDMGEIRILPRLLSKLRKVAPRCRIFVLDLWGEELKEGFERGEVDLAISGRGPPIGDVFQQKLYETGYLVLTSKSNPLNHDLSNEDLSGLRHVAVSPGRLEHLYLDDVLAQGGIRRNVVVRTANWVSVPHVLRTQPDLVSVVPQFLAIAYRDFDLKCLKLTSALPSVEVFQFWHRRATSDPYNIWLRAQIREMFGRQK
ncbi:MAG TPA: LysR substrate-binding domain-containing protein [Steroidobacteraceae bacterium]|jgi:DNA-binding transcriptional LysR family regulator|nr:LysR substrate-binding domain-containing protein [Steroidobacteraceae bacterium]